jgi:hypothetical protein
MTDDLPFMQSIGRAALQIWPDLPRDLQERLFEDAVGADATLRRHLALCMTGTRALPIRRNRPLSPEACRSSSRPTKNLHSAQRQTLD